MASRCAAVDDGDGYQRFFGEEAASTTPSATRTSAKHSYGSGDSDGLRPAGDDEDMMDSVSVLNAGEARRWEMNYLEAAIFLEEGANNEKFESHPRHAAALPAYRLVHNGWYNGLDVAASLLLLGLALAEPPAAARFTLPVGAHAALELLALAVIGVELLLKLQWTGCATALRHRRTALKAAALAVMLLEAVVVLARQTSHFRVTRALRPLFLVDARACGSMRRFIRQLLQALPPIADMLVLLLLVVGAYALLGCYLFSDPHFDSFADSFVSMFVLLTAANYPDVMMPAYAASRWSALFFVSYISVVLYLLMNLLLGGACEAFAGGERDKLRKLLLHRRAASSRAHRLLVARGAPPGVAFARFVGAMRFFAPRRRARDLFLDFRRLNASGSGRLSEREFAAVYDAVALRWRVQEAGGETRGPLTRLLRTLGHLVPRRQRDVGGALALLAPQLRSAAGVMLVLYYVFAVVGMELFAACELRDCCANTSLAAYYSTRPGGGFYYLNNFGDLLAAGVTLFELTVVNNWYVIMEAHVAVTRAPLARLYFMAFYLVTMVVLTIVVASVLEAFRFRIQYASATSERDEERMLREELLVDGALLRRQLAGADAALVDLMRRDLLLADADDVQVFVGRRPRTRELLQRRIYADDIDRWMAEEDGGPAGIGMTELGAATSSATV